MGVVACPRPPRLRLEAGQSSIYIQEIFADGKRSIIRAATAAHQPLGRSPSLGGNETTSPRRATSRHELKSRSCAARKSWIIFSAPSEITVDPDSHRLTVRGFIVSFCPSCSEVRPMRRRVAVNSAGVTINLSGGSEQFEHKRQGKLSRTT